MSTKHAIIKTLSYADIFDYPLKADEIHRFLIADQPITRQKSDESIHRLFSQGKIGSHQDFYFLQGKEGLVKQRKKREQISDKKIDSAQKIARQIGNLPGVLGIFLTGNVAMKNAAADDDIDVLIITRANRLWTTRALVTTQLDQRNLRRKPDSRSVKDLVCPNMYLDESCLTVPKNKQTLYTAHEVIQTKPLYDDSGIHHRFLTANHWLTDYLPNALPSDLAKVSGSTAKPSRLGNLIEKAAYIAQRLYMLRRRTNETVTPHMAYFHPRNTHRQVTSQYKQRLKQYLP